MLDSENRLNGARFFLQKGIESNEPEKRVWYIQAAVIFGRATVENLMYDYAERKTGKPLKKRMLRPNELRKIAGNGFYDWLKKQLNSELYAFLSEERNKIIHRGEPDKRIKIELTEPPTTPKISLYFQGYSKMTAEDACQTFIEEVGKSLEEAKQRYPELG